MKKNKETVCWVYCEAYQEFQKGERVKIADLCPSCPIKDFYRMMQDIAGVEDDEECYDVKVCDAPTCCDFCDFKDLTRFHEPCHSCDDAMRRNLIRQGQLKLIE